MPFKHFKLSACALALAGISSVSHAALYTIEPMTSASATQSSKATAISPDGNKVAVETYSGPEGDNYDQPLAYMVDTRHYINRFSEFERYCIDYLGYYTCQTWANEQWFGLKATGEVCEQSDTPQVCYGGVKKIIDAWTTPYTSNRIASFENNRVNPFGSGVTTPPSGAPNPDSTDVVIHAVTNVDGLVGNSSSPYYAAGNYNARAFIRRGFGFIDNTELAPASSIPRIQSIGQTNAKGMVNSDDTGTEKIIFGSSSLANMADWGSGNKVPEGTHLSSLDSCSSVVNYADRACQYFNFANQATIWISSSANKSIGYIVDDFPSGATANGDQTAQASINAAVIKTGESAPTMVGFTTYNESGGLFPIATKYSPVADFSTCLTNLETDPTKRCWARSNIPGINIRQNGDIYFSYTLATDINENGLIIGEAKYARESSGAYSEIVFVNDNATTTQLSTTQSALFFQGYNATAAAINIQNEIVGKVDIDQNRDRARRQRGYIYLHGDAANLPSFNNQRGWLLDDLTNDGNPSSVSNRYRIAEAFDISENGNIAASAFYCAAGYSSTTQNALCPGVEQLVAVKLTRQVGGIIQPRTIEKETIKRSGAGMGLFAFPALLFFGLMRRKKMHSLSACLHTSDRNKFLKP